MQEWHFPSMLLKEINDYIHEVKKLLELFTFLDLGGFVCTEIDRSG